MDYYAEEARKELTRRLERAKALSEAWKQIERYKTKDGKDFKNLASNFTKGAIKNQPYAPSEKRISADIRNEQGHYFDDWFNISQTVYSNSEEAEKYEAEGRLIQRGAYLHPYINLTPDEIEKAIAERIKYHEERAKDLEATLANFEEIANHLVELRHEAEAYIRKQPDEAYYVLRKIFKEER